MKTKIILRNIWAEILGLLPMALFEPIRKVYVRSEVSPYKRRAAKIVLSIVRYRRPDKKLSYITPIDNIDIKLCNMKSNIVQRIFWFGEEGYESGEGFWWKKYCSASKGIVELGANIGYYTILGALAAPKTRYLAVEPHPVTADYLQNNIDLNSIENVFIVRAAVVGRKTSQQMELQVPSADTDVAPTGAFLRKGGEGISRKSNSTVMVDVIEISELMENVDLVKMDIEGYEYSILNEMRRYSEINKPTYFIEVRKNTPMLRQLLIDMKVSYGYRSYVIGEKGIKELDNDELAEINLSKLFGNQDIIMTCQSEIIDKFS